MKRGLFLALFAFVGLLFGVKTAHAANASIHLRVAEEVLRVGDEFELTMEIIASPAEGETIQDATIGDFEAYLIYNADVMEFVTAPSCITGGAGMLRISDMGAQASQGSRTYVVRFQALARGTAEVSLDSRPMVYSYGKNIAMSVSSNVLILPVEPSKDASDNANLSALKVNPGKISPAFATTIREYEVSVPYHTEMLVVSALTEDENAVVGVNGSTGLQVGRNTVVVTVTAENGTEKRYYLYVTREKEAPPEPTMAPEEPKKEDAFETGLHAATEEDGSIYLSVAGRFKVSENAEAYVAPTGYEETVLYVDDIRIKAYVKRDVPDSGHFVLVLEDELGTAGFYRYDREQMTLQRFDEDRIEIKQVIEEDNSGLKDALEKYKSQQVLLLFLLALFIALSVLLLLIILRLYRQKHLDDGELDDR